MYAHQLVAVKHFEGFWKKYPRKEKVFAAFSAFTNALKTTSVDTIIAALDIQNSTRQELSFIYPYAHLWLKRESWKNVI